MANFVVDPAPYPDSGYVDVVWDDTGKSANWYAYRVYRRDQGDVDWTLLAQRTDVQTNYAFHDWLSKANITQEYSVVEVTSNDGGQTTNEEPHDPQAVTPADTKYWLVSPSEEDDPNVTNGDETLSIRLEHVNDDGFTDEYEEETLLLIGRGRKVDQGTRWGFSGSVSAQLRDKPGYTAREQYLDIKELKEDRGYVWFRSPFGDVVKVALGNVSYDRVSGVGTNPYLDLTLPYIEVA